MISEVIKQIRKENSLTQKDLAEKLYVSDKTISSWETGRTTPDIYQLERISILYKIPMNDLMKGNVSKFVVFKYRMIKLLKRTNQLIKDNLFLFILSLLLIMSLILPGTLNVKYAYFYASLIVFSAFIFLVVKHSIWYIIPIIMATPYLIENIILFVDPVYYSNISWEPLPTVLLNIFNWISLLLLVICALYGLVLLVRKHHNRFHHILIFLFNLISIFIVSIYNSTYSTGYLYSSFTDETLAVINKTDNFWGFTILYLVGLFGILSAQHLLKSKTFNNDTFESSLETLNDS